MTSMQEALDETTASWLAVAFLLSSFAAGPVLAVDPPTKRPTLQAHLDEVRKLT